MPTRRNVTFVTGTRADLGLMLRTLAAVRAHPRLRLTLIATGMHLDPRAGPKLAALKAAGLTPDLVVPWKPSPDPAHLAEVTGQATARLARAYRTLATDLVLVLGDRVEAFAAAAAAHVARIPLAHVHGGDRAEGQVDDSLRHAITQLAHLHLAACQDSADRLLRLGQHPSTVHTVGAPGVESIRQQAAPRSRILAAFPHVRESALVLLHPTSPDPHLEHHRATSLLAALHKAGLHHHLLLTPNNDPGSQGIHQAWQDAARQSQLANRNSQILKDLPRPIFLGLLRECRLLVGNSSAGIIEAASFGTPVVDVGPRQHGRMHGPNVVHASYQTRSLTSTLRAVLSRPRPSKALNPYDPPTHAGARPASTARPPGTARTIARLLAHPALTRPAPSKLLTY